MYEVIQCSSPHCVVHVAQALCSSVSCCYLSPALGWLPLDVGGSH